MAYVTEYGRPDLFITVTCNAKWEEIRNNVYPGQKAEERYDIVVQVFEGKIKKMMKLFTKSQIAGPITAYTYTWEWQKR